MSLFVVDRDRIPFTAMTDKCVVLDLDETLIHSFESPDSPNELGIFTDPNNLALRERVFILRLEDAVNEKGMGIMEKMWGITRPHTKEFLIFCFSYFRVVAVWSAAVPQYIDIVIKHVFRDLPRPHIIFTSNHMENEDGISHKPLTKIINELDLPEIMNLENTFIVDDISNNFLDNPDNGILIPKYNPPPTINALKTDDPTLGQLANWLIKPEVMEAVDVRELDKSQIFFP